MRTDETSGATDEADEDANGGAAAAIFCWVVYLGFSYLQLCPSYTFSIFWFIFKKYYCKKLKKNNFTNFDGF